MKRLTCYSNDDEEVIENPAERIAYFYAKRNQLSLKSTGQISDWKYVVNMGSGATLTNCFASDATASVFVTGAMSVSNNIGTIGYVARGTADSNRVGRRIAYQAVHIGGVVRLPAAMTVASVVSMYIIYDAAPQRSATLPTMASMFHLAGSADADSVPPITQNPRFTILKKWQWQFPIRSATIETDSVVAQFDDIINLGGLPSIYTDSDTGGSFANVLVGNLLLVTRGSTTIAQGAAGLLCNAGLYFSDE